MRAIIAFILIVGVAAECPNACSGHGTCGDKDTCSCYQNYQGNDCSERTCYFGIAHVDTPKGDLNADGYVSGPLTTVITGSEVYPWGTTEQYPNADANEGHFYMECSNKGICDRKSGECDCFDGYEGTACARAACPNDCSGHGTCESIKELAEMSHYDTNSHDVAATSPTTASDFTSSIEESYAYDLWDQDKTMGCKCDPVYYGADCSLRKCKYGVDPLFYDRKDGVIMQTTVVHLGSAKANRGDISGNFRIIFHDVFGEKYMTKPISLPSDPATLSPETVQLALEALPNGVISSTTADKIDITGTPPYAVTVARQHNNGIVTTDGSIGAGAAWTSATYTRAATTGLCQATGDTTPSNHYRAGDVDLDACKRECTKAGSNCFYFQHSVSDLACRIFVTAASSESEWTFTSGTGSDCAATPTANANFYMYEKTTEYGAGLGVSGDGYGDAYGPEFTITFSSNPGVLKTIELDVKEVNQPGQRSATGSPDYWVANTRQGQFESRYSKDLGRVNTLKYGSKLLYTNSAWNNEGPDTSPTAQQMVKIGSQEVRVTAASTYMLTLSEEFLGEDIIPILTDTGSTATAFGSNAYTLSAAPSTLSAIVGNSLKAGAKLYVNGCPSVSTDADVTDTSMGVETDNDCAVFSGRTETVYRRSDNPANQHLYLTTSDSAVATQALQTTRGSPDVYVINPTAVETASAWALSSGTFTMAGTNAATGDVLFANGWGPFTVTTGANTATVVDVPTYNPLMSDTATVSWSVHKQATVSGVAAGNILALNGRRYKVKEVNAAGGRITLTENFAGGALLKLCDNCVTAYVSAGTSVTVAAREDGTHVTLAAGDKIAIGGLLHEDMVLTVGAAYTGTGGTITTLAGAGRGINTGAASSDASTQTRALYKLVNQNTNGYVGSVITENDDSTGAISGADTAQTYATIGTQTYQYVSQCSNRGTCDSSTGVCKCFKGYSRDNCDTQNMLAA